MKQMKYYLMAAMMLATSAGFTSCGDDDEDTIKGGPLEQLDGVGYPKGLTELDFFLLFCL